MKREALLAIGLAAGSVAGVCGGIAVGNEIVGVSSMVSAEQAWSTPIALDKLPESMPSAVLNRMVNVVKVVNNPNPTHGSVASGIRIDNDHVLTAGHLLYTEKNKPYESTDRCDVVQLDAPGTLFASFGQNNNVRIIKHIGSYSTEHSNIPDVALLDASTSGDSLEQVEPVPLRTTPMQPGESVFFLNYQPTAQHLERDPNPSRVTDYKLLNPAMYGGVVVARTTDGTISVLTGLKNYGDIPDDILRDGGSGGAAFDELGNLIGLTNGSYDPSSIKQIESEYGSKIIGVPQDREFTRTVITPINEQLMGHLATKLAVAPHCIP